MTSSRGRRRSSGSSGDRAEGEKPGGRKPGGRLPAASLSPAFGLTGALRPDVGCDVPAAAALTPARLASVGLASAALGAAAGSGLLGWGGGIGSGGTGVRTWRAISIQDAPSGSRETSSGSSGGSPWKAASSTSVSRQTSAAERER
jgi:hypothetical protein